MAKLTNLARMTVTGAPGTGSVTLNAAVAPYLTFALSGVVDGDVVYYAIKDGTSNSEIGIGTYTASGTSLSRDTVLNSTNAGAKISATSACEVFITPPATAFREVLTAARTYYVLTTGSDSNTGLANTAGGAFLTIQKAIDTIAGLDTSIYNVTIQVGNGTYTGANTLKNFGGAGTVTIQGNTGTPSSAVLSTTSANPITGTNIFSSWALAGFKLQTTTSGQCIQLSNATLSVNQIEFGACAGYHVYAVQGSFITFNNNYTISGGGVIHWACETGSVVTCIGKTVTLTGTPAFSTAFAFANRMGVMVVYSNTFSGAATGPRYNVSGLSLIDTNGGGATYLPGNSAGSGGTTTGAGLYN